MRSLKKKSPHITFTLNGDVLDAQVYWTKGEDLSLFAGVLYRLQCGEFGDIVDGAVCQAGCRLDDENNAARVRNYLRAMTDHYNSKPMVCPTVAVARLMGETRANKTTDNAGN